MNAFHDAFKPARIKLIGEGGIGGSGVPLQACFYLPGWKTGSALRHQPK